MRTKRSYFQTRGEGLVIKTPNSKYILGGRENCWMKVKPEYMVRITEEAFRRDRELTDDLRTTWENLSTFL